MKIIYLDNAATTPIDPNVAAKMQDYLSNDELFGNPSSLHSYGDKARNAIQRAREQIATLIHASADEIIFTSGATEAINLAIKGGAELRSHRGKHIITLQSEHKATLDSCQHLEKMGFNITYLPIASSGLVELQQLREAIRDDTILISVAHVNNETGIVQDLASIAKLTQEHNILLHVDAAQTPGKAKLNVQDIPIDLISMCAHKTYGPKGIGVLFLRKKPRVRVAPLIHGGGHEQGMRSGTLATHQIVGMGEAFQIASENFAAELKHITELRDEFLQKLSAIKKIKMNTEREHCVPHIANIRFDGMIADAILKDLPMLAVSTGSACQGKGIEGSHVLRAMGLTSDEVKSSIRFSFGRFTTKEDVREAANAIQNLFSGGKNATPIVTGFKL